MSNNAAAYDRQALAEAEAARQRAHQERLRRLVNDLQIAPADTQSVEESLASLSAAKTVIDRHLDAATADLDAVAHRLKQNSDAATKTFDTARREAQAFKTEIDQRAAELSSTIHELNRERTARAQAARRHLDDEIAADCRHDDDLAARQIALVQRADRILAGVSRDAVDRAALAAEASVLSGRRSAIEQVTGEEGVIAARRLVDDSDAFARDVRWRAAKVAGFQRALTTEIAQLRKALEFSEDERRLLVGSEASGLDGPLRRELQRLQKLVADPHVGYESIEHRVADWSTAIANVAAEVERIGSDVRHFNQLNERRFTLIDGTLPDMLTEVTGRPVEKVSETLPDLALKPVEVQYRVPSTNEIIDCTIGLDGAVSVHHHQHATVSACVDSAKRLAEILPKTLSVTRVPTLDTASPAPQDSTPYVVRPTMKGRS
jgi:hypothetical protein